MSEKNMGRKFKVGDKVKLTKAGEESGAFASRFREGDVAEVLLLNSFDDFISSVKVITGKATGYLQYCDANTDTRAWFEHKSPKKKRKKQRKYFRTGDFVLLKDGVNTEKVTRYNDIDKGAIGLVFESVLENWVPVGYSTEEGDFDYDYVHSEALRLATKDERKSLRKHKVAKITYNNPCDNVSEQIEQGTEVLQSQVKIPKEYDVKVGDIVEVTKYSCGHSVGAIVKVVEVRPLGYFSGYNTVRAVGFDGREWSEDDVKLVHRAMSTCEDEDNSVPNSVATPATEEEKVVMLGDNLVNHYTESIYKVILIDDIFESELPYHITSKNESMWISDGTVVQDYGKLLEDGRVYDWVTDTTFANVESWTNSAK